MFGRRRNSGGGTSPDPRRGLRLLPAEGVANALRTPVRLCRPRWPRDSSALILSRGVRQECQIAGQSRKANSFLTLGRWPCRFAAAGRVAPGRCRPGAPTDP